VANHLAGQERVALGASHKGTYKMTIEQTATDLLEALDSMLYMNDFGGLQCNRDDATDIQAAIDKLEQAISKQENKIK
jgi:ribosome-associated translation inhibitor RaiA